ncbi:MAG: potassium channel family protein [Smithella sp.]
MHQPIRSIISEILKARFSYLFLTIIMLFMFRPFIEGAKAVTAATNIFVWFIVVSCVWAVHEKRRRQWFVITMASMVILFDLLDFVIQSTVTSWASKIAIFFFLGYAVVSILFYLARQKEVTADMLMAGASEYMLIGILWSWLYYLIETVYPGSFSITGIKTDRFGFLYFSFVTLTTTGYGDILPLSVQARSLAILEQITGQLFIAITVARLLSLYTVRGRKQ